MHGALNIVSGGCDEYGETEGSNQPGFTLQRRRAAAAALAKQPNNGRMEIDVAPSIQIDHPKQVAARTMPDRLLNKA